MDAWQADFGDRAGQVTLPSLRGRPVAIPALRGDEQQRVPVEPAGIVGVLYFAVPQERLREEHELIVGDRSEDFACFPARPLKQPGHPGVVGSAIRAGLLRIAGGRMASGRALMTWGFGVWPAVGGVGVQEDQGGDFFACRL